MSNKDITIVITTFKSELRIENCLNSIDSSIKTIVVENSNNEKFKEYIEKKYINVECILPNENLGYGRGNNVGLKKVKTKYSLILNPDTILEKEAVNNFFFFLRKNKDFAILGPDQNENQILTEKKKSKLLDPAEVDSIKGFAMFLNMEKFEHIGFFDENFFLYLEEIDLCKRIKKIKEKIYLDPNIKIFHHGGKSVNEIFRREIELTRNWHWMWSLFYYNKKHTNYFYALTLLSPKFFSALFKIFLYLILFNRKKKEIYQKRLSGLINSIMGRPAWYRPTFN